MPEEAKVEEPQSEVKSAKSSNLLKILLVIILALISSAGGGVISWYLISRTTLKAEAKTAEVLDPVKAKREQVAEALEKGGALPLEPFVVNLADPDAARYLRIRVSLMIDDGAKLPVITANTALQQKIRDVILQTLSRKTSQDLITEDGKNKLRQEIQEEISGYFKKPKLVDVMFTEFVIQL